MIKKAQLKQILLDNRRESLNPEQEACGMFLGHNL